MDIEMDIEDDEDEEIGFWATIGEAIVAAEDRTFALFGLDKRSALDGSAPMIAPLLLFAIAFAMLVVSYVITSLLVKRPKVKPAALEDWDFPQSDEGTPETVFFGDNWTDGPQVMWYGNYRTKKIKSKSKK